MNERTHELLNRNQRSRSGQQSMQHLFKGNTKQSEKQLLGVIGQIGRDTSRHQLTKSYDKGNAVFTGHLDPMIRSRPLIGRE